MSFFPFLIPFFLSISIVAGCGHRPAERPSPAQGGKSMLERQWDSALSAIPTEGRNGAGAKLEALERLFAELSPGSQRAEIQRVMSSKVPRSEYEQIFIQAVVSNYADAGKDQDLLEVLTFHCPRYIGPRHVEFVLARGALRDPINLLREAFIRSTSTENKQHIISIFADSFPDIAAGYDLPVRQQRKITSEEIHGADRFLLDCRRWWLLNREHLRLNTQYESNVSKLLQDSGGLFISKGLDGSSCRGTGSG